MNVLPVILLNFHTIQKKENVCDVCSCIQCFLPLMYDLTPTMHCMDLIRATRHCELINEENRSAYIFFRFVSLTLEIYFMLTSSLFHVGVIFIDARHAFYQQSHCVNCKHYRTLHFCFAEGFHLVNIGLNLNEEKSGGTKAGV